MSLRVNPEKEQMTPGNMRRELERLYSKLLSLTNSLDKRRDSWNGDNVSEFGIDTDFGSGRRVRFVSNAINTPTGNPADGVILYADSGAYKARGSSGTITTLATAEPHCPVCGGDYVLERDNERYGYFAICLICLANKLGEQPWIVRGKSRLREKTGGRL